MFPEYGGDDSPYALLAAAYEKKGDKRKQADVLAKWTTLTETNSKALLKLADLLEQLGDAKGAADALDRAMFVNPFDLAMHQRLAGLAHAAGDKQKVVRERAAIVALGPVDKADALLPARARAARGGRRRHARKSVLRALEEAPNYEKAQTLLLTLYERAHASVRRKSHEHAQIGWTCRRCCVAATTVAAAQRRRRGVRPVLRRRRATSISRRRSTATRRTTAASPSRASSIAASSMSGREGPGWSHDYPDAEENFTKILRDITIVRPFVEAGPMVGSVLVALDDPPLFKYPVSYMSEPGGWHPNDKEIAGFRAYLLKGGFMIFDDFREGWRGELRLHAISQQIVEARCRTAKWVQLTGKEPIFDSFFKIDLSTVRSSGTSAYGTRPADATGASTRTTIRRSA